MTSFTKMEGLGNDFVVLEGPATVSPDQAVAWCDRTRGIGADGVLVVTGARGSVHLSVRNANGSSAELSGNGLRCAARFAHDRGWAGDDPFVIETAAGRHRVDRQPTGDFRVELGEVRMGPALDVGGRTVQTADIGNPHAVLLSADPDAEDVASVGQQVAAVFETGANVGFLAVDRPDRLRLRVWERGVGETLACGTGAAAAHAVARDRGEAASSAVVELKGGDLAVEIVDGISWIAGPARYVFEGTWDPR